MPKSKLLVDWVKQGAVDPRTANSAKKKFDGSPLNWWSLQPLKTPRYPDQCSNEQLERAYETQSDRCICPTKIGRKKPVVITTRRSPHFDPTIVF